MNIVEPINQFRVEEKDKLIVQFFDKKRQITNEDLETVDVLDKNGKPIYDLYVEIFNREDPYSVVCKNVKKNDAIFYVNGVKKRYKYNEIYKKAFAIYNKRKDENKIDKDSEIAKLQAELEAIKKTQEEIKPIKGKKTQEVKENEENINKGLE